MLTLMRFLSSRVIASAILSAAAFVGLPQAPRVEFGPLSASAHTWPSRAQQVQARLTSEQIPVRRQAARELSSLSSVLARAPTLVALQDEDDQVRLSAARAVVLFGYDEAALRVTSWMRDRSVAIRAAAVRILALAPTGQNLSLLGRSLLDADEVVRVESARALGRAPSMEHSDAAALVIVGLGDASPRVRALSAESLGRVGDESATLALSARLSDQDVGVRRRAALALGLVGGETALGVLSVAMSDSSKEVRLAVYPSLGRLLGRSWPEPRASEAQALAVARLSLLLSRPSFDDESAAAGLALGKSSLPLARAALVSALVNPEAEAVVVSAFSEASNVDVLQALEPCLAGAALDHLARCTRVAQRHGLGDDKVVQLAHDGRLSPETVLAILGASVDEEALVLALELLLDSSTSATGIRFLEASAPLPPKALGPVRQALLAWGTPSSERSRLFRLLEPLRGEVAVGLAKRYMSATEPSVRASAARMWVTADPKGQVVLDFLQSTDAFVAVGVAELLSTGSVLVDFEMLVAALPASAGQQRDRLLTALSGAPSGLSAPALALLQEQLTRSRRGDRDRILEILGRQKGATGFLVGLLEAPARADRQKSAEVLAQSARGWVDLSGHLGGPDWRVQVTLLSGLKLKTPAAQVAQLTQRPAPSVVRAAALGALQWADSVPVAVTESACDGLQSDHLGLRAAALLFLSNRSPSGDLIGGNECPTSLSNTLSSDPEPAIRVLAAEALKVRVPGARALAVCQTYEVSPEVAKACHPGSTELIRAVRPGTVREQSIVMQSPLAPESLIETPFALLDGRGRIRFGMTDRSGRILFGEGSDGARKDALGELSLLPMAAAF